MRWLDGIKDSVDMGLGRLRELNKAAWHAAVHGVTKSQTRLSDWTELKRTPKWHTHKRKVHVETEAEIWLMWSQAKECQEPLETRISKVGFFPKIFQENVALLVLWFQISVLQNCARVNFWGLKPANLYNYVIPRKLICDETKTDLNWEPLALTSFSSIKWGVCFK